MTTWSRKNSKNSMKVMVVVIRRRGYDVEEELKELDEGHDDGEVRRRRRRGTTQRTR